MIVCVRLEHACRWLNDRDVEWIEDESGAFISEYGYFITIVCALATIECLAIVIV